MGIFNETVQLPQNRKDSINVAVFKISTTPSLSINYCYEVINVSGGGIACQYNEVLVDKLQNRDEYRRINGFGDTKKRLVDKNNSLINDVNFNQPHYTQVLHAINGDYRLYQWNTVNDINTPFGVFNAINSVIPDKQIIRFDTDKYNNLWLATSKGLVGFNNTGLVLSNQELKSDSEGFKIYPNPTKSMINLELMPNWFSEQIKSNEMITIEIRNTFGQILINETTTNQALNKFSPSYLTFNVQHLRIGMYFVTLTAKYKTATIKFLKD